MSKLDNLFNNIRSKIEIIEKQRCWFSVLNNRLYKRLQKELKKYKSNMDKKAIEKLGDILDDYIENALDIVKILI